MVPIKIKFIDFINRTGFLGQYFCPILTIMSIPSPICKDYHKHGDDEIPQDVLG